jgi:hypothetical protein
MAAAVEAMLRRMLRRPGAHAVLVNPAAASRAGVQAFQGCVAPRLEKTLASVE